MNRLVVVLLALTILPMPQAQAQSKQQKRPQGCQPIGRVISPQAQQICQGFTNSISDQFKVFCYSSLRIIPVVGGKLSEDCLPLKQQRADKQGGSTFRKNRGNQPGRFALKQPHGSVTIQSRPLISWEAILGAEIYRVKVEDSSSKSFWYRDVRGTSIQYPEDAQPLQPGSVYTILVESQHPETSETVQASKVIISLSQDQKQTIDTAVATIKSLNLSRDQETLDLEMVYRGQSLHQSSIEILEKSIAGGSQNPEIYLVLGYRYREQGLIDKAKEFYLQSIEASTQQKRADTLSEAQKALLQLETVVKPEKQAHLSERNPS